jgi:hypothetical protein
MKKITATLLLSFTLAYSFAQTQRKISTFLLAEYNKTMGDHTKYNNPWGAGLGLQAMLNSKTKFNPTIELTGALYLEDDKVLRLNADGSIPDRVEEVVNLFAGASFFPIKTIYLSVLAGPSFINGQTLLGIKPSFGFYFSSSQKWTGKISYIDIFNRDKTTRTDFSSLSIALGFKLF